MRTILACVAGVAGLYFAGPSAMAEQPGWEQGVQRARFVAPEPQPASPAPVVERTARRGLVGEVAVGYAYASDDENQAASAGPAPAGNAGYADASDDDRQKASANPIPATAVEYAYAADNEDQAASAEPTPAEDVGYADPSDDSQTASADPVPAGRMGYSYADDDYNNDWVVYSDSTVYCPYRDRSGRRLIGSTCTMGQHSAYFPPMHGYYYFHPYHHSHVRTHQMFAQLWGEDPANPYSNRLFQMVYEQYRDEVAAEQPPLEP